MGLAYYDKGGNLVPVKTPATIAFKELPLGAIFQGQSTFYWMKVDTIGPKNSLGFFPEGLRFCNLADMFPSIPIQNLTVTLTYPKYPNLSRIALSSVPILGAFKFPGNPEEEVSIVLSRNGNWVRFVTFHANRDDDRVVFDQKLGTLFVKYPENNSFTVQMSCPPPSHS